MTYHIIQKHIQTKILKINVSQKQFIKDVIYQGHIYDAFAPFGMLFYRLGKHIFQFI